ncbi:MAG: ABC transporter permease [Lacisediminihabitans sp.]
MAITAFTAATSAVDAPKRRSKVALFLLLPGLLYLALFFLVPLVSLVITSLQVPDPAVFGRYTTAFHIQMYGEVIAEYGTQILRSFFYALLSTIFALLFSYPLAYFIGVKVRRWPILQGLMIVLVIAPFFISFLLRTLAWKSILSDDGVVVSALKGLSLLGSQDHFTGTPAAVVFGLTYNFIPFMCLPLYTTLERLDVRYLEAASDLYSRPFHTFRTVTLPLSLPGIVSGTLLTFIPAAGDYVNASSQFLGGSSSTMIGNVIQSNFLVQLNYPAAAALSIILMAIILVIVAVYVKRSGTDDLV